MFSNLDITEKRNGIKKILPLVIKSYCRYTADINCI